MKRFSQIRLALCMFPLVAAIAAANYEPKTIEQGAVAPDFSLKGTDDKLYTLQDLKGEKATVIIFTTNHCPDAIAGIGRTKALVEHFEGKGVGVFAINSNSPEGLHLRELAFSVYDDSFEDMKKLVVSSELNYPYLYDGDTQEVAKAYGAVATPHAFVFDADLKLCYNGRLDNGRRSIGPTDKNETRDAVEAVLKGEVPAVVKTRPIGCSTKWKEKAGAVAVQDKKWAEQPVTVETIDAETVGKLARNKGREGMRLINVWSTTCGPCVMEFPELSRIYRRFTFHDFELITISLDPPSDSEKVKTFLEENECGLGGRTANLVKKDGRTTNNYIFDGDTEDLAKALDSEWNGAMPHTLFVGADGEVVYRHTGIIDAEKLKKVVVDYIWASMEE